MNDGRHRAGRSLQRLSIAVSSALIIISCSGGVDPTPTPATSPTPARVTEEVAAAPTPIVPAPTAAAPETSFTHRSVVVVIPADALASPTADIGDTVVSSSVEPTATAAPFVREDSIDTTDKRLNVTVGGETVYIRNGGRIEMGDGLAVEIFIDPYPPTTLHSVLDVYVTQDGEPAQDISVDVEFDMLSMLHGPFNATARDIGGGHHLATLDYIMFGAWDQFVTLRLGLDRIRFPVVIVAYP